MSAHIPQKDYEEEYHQRFLRHQAAQMGQVRPIEPCKEVKVEPKTQAHAGAFDALRVS